jgi:plastocyanin
MVRASELSGTVTLPNGQPAIQAVVYIEGGKKSEPLTHAMVDQRHKTFLPHVSVVTVGTTVRFPNDDTVFHNVFAYYDAKKFDLGMYPKGASRSVTFDKPGVVALLCNIHSEMSAYIMVVDTPYYAVTDSKGRFMIDLPAGHYTLHGWCETGQTVSVPVDAADGAAPLTVTLRGRT